MAFIPWPADMPAPDALHHARLELILIHSLSESWQTTLLAAPGWASDFAAPLQTDDFNVALALLMSRTWSDRLTAGIGVSYVQDRSPVVLPIGQLLWKNGRAWSADILLPATAHLWYQLRAPLKAGFAWRAVLLPYNLSDTVQAGADRRLRRQLFSLGPALRVPIAGGVSLQVEGGLTLRNRIVFVTGTGELTLDYNSSFFVWAGLVLQGE